MEINVTDKGERKKKNTPAPFHNLPKFKMFGHHGYHME